MKDESALVRAVKPVTLYGCNNLIIRPNDEILVDLVNIYGEFIYDIFTHDCPMQFTFVIDDGLTYNLHLTHVNKTCANLYVSNTTHINKEGI